MPKLVGQIITENFQPQQTHGLQAPTNPGCAWAQKNNYGLKGQETVGTFSPPLPYKPRLEQSLAHGELVTSASPGSRSPHQLPCGAGTLETRCGVAGFFEIIIFFFLLFKLCLLKKFFLGVFILFLSSSLILFLIYFPLFKSFFLLLLFYFLFLLFSLFFL